MISKKESGRIKNEIFRGRRGGSVVGASYLGPEGREFEPWPLHPRCVLRHNT